MAILHEQDSRMSELHSSHQKISIELKILLPERPTATEMAQKIPFLSRFCTLVCRI